MSRFWRYFHEKLNWPLIFRPGPISALARGLALCMDDAREDILWLRDQWNPQTADESLIAAYGKSRGILRNRYDTDKSYRLRVVNAYAWHKLGGKVRGLERILREGGFDAAVKNSENPDLWAHFRLLLELGDKFFGPDEYALFWWLANEYKPARSVIEALSTRREIGGAFSIAIGGCQRTKNQAFTWIWPMSMPDAHVAPGIGLVDKSKTLIWALIREQTPAPAEIPSALAAYSYTRSKICHG